MTSPPTRCGLHGNKHKPYCPICTAPAPPTAEPDANPLKRKRLRGHHMKRIEVISTPPTAEPNAVEGPSPFEQAYNEHCHLLKLGHIDFALKMHAAGRAELTAQIYEDERICNECAAHLHDKYAIRTGDGK